MTPAGLDALGITPAIVDAFAPFEARQLVLGRVVAGHSPRLFRVATGEGDLLAELSGSLRHAALGPQDLPAVGDWVALRPRSGGGASLMAVLPRRTAFVRRAAGDRSVAQVLAANVDTAFLVMALDANYNLRRLERMLVLAWESGASPVVVLNKADLSTRLEEQLAEIRGLAPQVPIVVLAAKLGQGLDGLSPWLVAARTVVLLGSSGVGKSTIVNRLLGRERQRTGDVREADRRGRHTTSVREMLVLPGGALLIDTPGLREIQLWSEGAGLQAAFEDVETLAAGCRFSNCSHQSEPGCAVRAAVAAERLDPARLDSYLKLTAELRALEVREDPLKRREERSRWKAIQKSYKDKRET